MSFDKCSCDRNKIIIGMIFGGLLVGAIIGIVLNVVLQDKGKFKNSSQTILSRKNMIIEKP